MTETRNLDRYTQGRGDRKGARSRGPNVEETLLSHILEKVLAGSAYATRPTEELAGTRILLVHCSEPM